MCCCKQGECRFGFVVVVVVAVAVVIIVVFVVVLTLLTHIIKSVVTGQATVTLELRNTPGKKAQTKGGTRICHS